MSKKFYLSNKNFINQPTELLKRSNYDIFMSNENIINISKQIYILHKNNRGLNGYLYFKDIIPKRMYKWAIHNNINKYSDVSSLNSIVDVINKKFIHDNYDLYDPKTNDSVAIPDSNVFKSSATLSSVDDNKVLTEEKKYSEFMADDYGKLDVWQETAININNEDIFRYKNKIPLWQSSMSTRHYDRSNEGLRTSSDRSSLGNLVRGNKYDMESLAKLSDHVYSKFNV